MRTMVIHVGFPFLLFNGILLIAALSYPAWMSGRVTNVAVPYIAGSPTHINASIGVHVGLGGMNITWRSVLRKAVFVVTLDDFVQSIGRHSYGYASILL